MRQTPNEAPTDWQRWLAERDEARQRVRIVAAAFPGPYRRTRPRDADEAKLLRRLGTPENLIGPVDRTT